MPKIPSMTIENMMKTLAPDIPRRVVGLRPGEKVHEVLISEEDTATVLELEDRFIVCPPEAPRVQSVHEQHGAKVAPAGLRYASDNNKVWLDPQGLKQLLPTDRH